jgi:hypothetical protein
MAEVMLAVCHAKLPTGSYFGSTRRVVPKSCFEKWARVSRIRV